MPFTGLNNQAPAETLGLDGLRIALNVDLTATGQLERRPGSRLLTDKITHSLWAGSICLGVGESFLRELDTDLETVTDLYGFAVDAPTVYAEIPNGDVHFTNNDIHGVVSDGSVTIFVQGVGAYARSNTRIEQAEEAAYYDEPPPGTGLEWGFGRLFVMTADGFEYSNPFFPRRFDREHNYIPLSNPTFVKVVPNGIYFGTAERVYFLPGGNPKAPVLREVSKAGAIKGTAVVAPGKLFGDGFPGAVCVWDSVDGCKMLGTQDGEVVDLTGKNYRFPAGVYGAAMLRERNGQVHHLSLLYTDGETANARPDDFTISEIRRNSVIL